MTDDDIASLLPAIPFDANKYTRGSLLVLGGSTRFPGAAILAVQAAARTGAGYVTLATPGCISKLAQSHLLSIPVIAAPEAEGAFAADSWPAICERLNHLDAIVIGPGLTVTPSTCAFVKSVLQTTDVPVLVDADALNCLCKEREPFACGNNLNISNSALTVFTPHAGELKRLLEATGTTSPEDLAALTSAIVVVKGPTTRIISNEYAVESRTGTPALAKAGTGDVLSGIIGSLLAQKVPPFDAARLGVEIHSRAGILAEQCKGRRSVIAEDIVETISEVLREIESQPASFREPHSGKLKQMD